MTLFQDRRAAGRVLAELLAGRGYGEPVVLALPRGGVPVALEVALRLGAPLDLVMVRKIGLPYQPELAAGAVVNGDSPEIVINEDVAQVAGLSRADIGSMAEAQLEEIARRRERYLGSRATEPVAGRTAIVVDDGIATGATMRAALHAVRRRGPAHLVLAVPVAPSETLSRLAGEADEIVCAERPRRLRAVGAHYEDFRQVEDAEVIALLDAARRPATDAGG